MYDAIVIGLGGMGAAALSSLARRGRRVLGIEQFSIGHDRGSSHGHTRVIRTAYYEHPDYVPLCRQSFAAWRDLERRSKRTLLVDCPCLSIGPPDGELVSGVVRAAHEHDLPVERLAPDHLRHRFPQFQFDANYSGILEHESGFLYVDRCVRALVDDAMAAGAEVRENVPVIHWHSSPVAASVQTAGEEIRAARLVITAGPWAGQLLKEVNTPLTVMRQVGLWFETRNTENFQPERFPVFMADLPGGCYYGIPATDGHGLKIARHYGAAELAGPAEIRREILAEDELAVRDFIRQHLPEANGPLVGASVCIYTLTPDRHFVIDRDPAHANVAVACGFSGHGFKFAPVVGELLADLVDERRAHGPDLFRASRFEISSARQ
jgi:sarcosine oxidase